MVVVGVIALLASIAAPGLKQARGDVRLAKARADLKAINNARLLYCSDTGDADCDDINTTVLVPQYLKSVPIPPCGLDYEWDWGFSTGGTRIGHLTYDDLFENLGIKQFMDFCN